MQKYKIIFSKEAKQDYLEIIGYLKYNLIEPKIAEKYSKIIMSEIQKLEYSPKKFAIYDGKVKNYKNIRRLIIKNYIVFYRVKDETRTVNVERILYGGTNWQTIF